MPLASETATICKIQDCEIQYLIREGRVAEVLHGSAGENGGKKQAFHVIVPSLPGKQPLRVLQDGICTLQPHQVGQHLL